MQNSIIKLKNILTSHKLLWLLSLIFVLVIVFLRLKTQENQRAQGNKEKFAIVAITQIVEHASLDQEREGILLALKEGGYTEGKNLKIIYQNAQGSPVAATQIAQKLVSLQPDVIVAISTPSAQSALAAIRDMKIPLVFTAVTDPVSAHLVKNLEHPGVGVTGVTDYLSPEPQLQLIKQLIPNLKTLGIIYNPGESNSTILYSDLQKKSLLFNIKLVAVTANRTSEVATAAQSLVGRVDAIYIPNDNTAVSAIDSIVRVGIENKLSVFAGDSTLVLRGTMGGAGYNRTDLGRAAGNKIIQILKNGYAQEIPVQSEHRVERIVNENAAEKMGLKFSPEMLNNLQLASQMENK